MGDKDDFFKSFFSRSAFFLEFLRYFVPEVDPDELQTEDLNLDSSLFADIAFGNRKNDILYHIKRGNREIYVVILMEHQSTVDYSTASR